MTEYVVTWQIDIEADSPEEAAREARYYQNKPGTTADVFDVVDASGDTTRIDLTELDEERLPILAGTVAALGPWTSENSIAADAESWNLFDTDDGGGLRIQRDDEADAFSSDANAIRHVREQARSGQPHAIKAIAIHDLSLIEMR